MPPWTFIGLRSDITNAVFCRKRQAGLTVDLAESFREESLINIGDGLVDLVFGGGDTSLIIPFGIAQDIVI